MFFFFSFLISPKNYGCSSPLEDFFDVEDRDGVRLSWNVFPTTIANEKEMVIPLGVLYSPLKKSPQPPPLLQYDPVIARGLVVQS